MARYSQGIDNDVIIIETRFSQSKSFFCLFVEFAEKPALPFERGNGNGLLLGRTLKKGEATKWYNKSKKKY